MRGSETEIKRKARRKGERKIEVKVGEIRSVHERKGGDSPFGQSDRLANALTYGSRCSFTCRRHVVTSHLITTGPGVCGQAALSSNDGYRARVLHRGTCLRIVISNLILIPKILIVP